MGFEFKVFTVFSWLFLRKRGFKKRDGFCYTEDMVKKIGLVILAIVILVFLLGFLKGLRLGLGVDFSKQYPAANVKNLGFEKKKTGTLFTIYYHPESETNANKSLAVLEQAGLPLFKKYLGLEPKETSVFLITSLDEYVKKADFPGGKENVQIGDGSVSNGKIFFYRPFEEERLGKTEGMIVHEGTHGVVTQFLGEEGKKFLPGFLNEGLAHYLEYVYKDGPNFKPQEQIYHFDLLAKGVKTGEPKLLSLAELGQKCDNYISDETLNFLCRGQGTYTVWSLVKTYQEDILGKFLRDLKQNQDWQKSLTNLTGKPLNLLGQEILDQLKLMVK